MVWPAVIAAAGSVLGGLLSNSGGSESSGRAGKAAWGMFNLARNIDRQLRPLRPEIIAMLMQELQGGTKLTDRYFLPQAKEIEGSYNESRRRLMNIMPQGGALDRSLGNLEVGRANTRANTQSSIRNGLFEQAMATAWGQPAQLAMNGMANGAGVLGNLQMQQNALNQQTMMGLGQGISAIGSGLGRLGSSFGGAGNNSGTIGASGSIRDKLLEMLGGF